MVRLSTRGGVPVLSRSVSNPRRRSSSVRPVQALSPARPASTVCRPTQILPFMKVPVVSTTAGARKRIPKWVRTPATASLASTSSPVTIPSRRCRFGVASSTSRIAWEYSCLSVCARRAHTAGPFDVFSRCFCT